MLPGKCLISFSLNLLWGPASPWVSVKQLLSLAHFSLRVCDHAPNRAYLSSSQVDCLLQTLHLGSMMLPFFWCHRPEKHLNLIDRVLYVF